MSMRIYQILVAAALVSAAVAPTAEAATVTPGAAKIGLTAHAGLHRDLSTVVTRHADQQGLLQPVSAEVNASIGEAGRTLSTGASMTATFLSAAHGRIAISDAGWRGQNVAQGLYAHASLRASAGFSYEFSISAPALLYVSFDIRADPASTDLFGLQGLRLRDLGNGIAGGVMSNAVDPVMRGTITRDLLPGTYTLGLGIESNISGLPGTRISLMDATVEWSIGDVDWSAAPVEVSPPMPPVPLPSSIALVCGALASICILRVARRATPTRAP